MTDTQDVDALKRRGRRRLIGAIALMLLAVIVLPMVFDAEPRMSAPPVNVRIPDEDGAAFKPRVLPPGTTEAPRGANPSAVADAPKESPANPTRDAPSPTPLPSAVPATPATSPALTSVPPAAASAPPVSAAQEAPPKVVAEPTPPVKTVAPAPAAPDKGPVAAKSPTAPAPSAAKAAPASGGFMIPIAALAEVEKVRTLTGSLSAAKIPYYTEPLATAKGKVTRVRAGPFASKEQADQALTKLKGMGLKPGNVTARNG